MQKIENIWPVDEFFFHRKFLYYDDFFPTVVFDPNEVSNWNEMKTRKNVVFETEEKERCYSRIFQSASFWIEKTEKKASHHFKRSSERRENPAFPFYEWREAYRKQSVKVDSKSNRKRCRLQNGSFVKLDFSSAMLRWKKGMKYKENLRDRLQTRRRI